MLNSDVDADTLASNWVFDLFKLMLKMNIVLQTVYSTYLGKWSNQQHLYTSNHSVDLEYWIFDQCKNTDFHTPDQCFA